jgi:hypothetical protein
MAVGDEGNGRRGTQQAYDDHQAGAGDERHYCRYPREPPHDGHIASSLVSGG